MEKRILGERSMTKYKRKMLLDEFDKLHDELVDIVTNRCLPYVDDLDMLDYDINDDLEDNVFDNMSTKELEDYVNRISDILQTYRREEE